MNKRGVNPIVGYVLLIVIILIISLITYNWIKTYKLGGGLECPEGVSLVIQKVQCTDHKVDIEVKNNGLFDIEGYIIRGDKEGGGIIDLSEGYYYFLDSPDGKLTPDSDPLTKLFGGKKENYNNKIISVEITPIRFEKNEKGKKFITMCTNAITKKDIDGYCVLHGDGIGDPECHKNHLELCDPEECSVIGGYWWDDECHEEIEPLKRCSDGTYYGECSATKPKYCDNGKLIYACDSHDCKCPTGYKCQDDVNDENYDSCEEIKYYVFVTYQSYDGNLGGISGANLKCNLPDNNKPKGEGAQGPYKALISTSGSFPVIAGIDLSGAIYSGHSGKKIANNYAEFKIEDFQNSILEFGIFSEEGLVWTGAEGKDCENWKIDKAMDDEEIIYYNGRVGDANSKTKLWNYGQRSCDGKYRLYCIGPIN